MVVIYISGIDGCGKTTQAHLLRNWLAENGTSVEYQWLRWEPSILPLIKRVRELLVGKSSSDDTKPVPVSAREDRNETQWANLKKWLLSNNIAKSMWLFYATRDYYRSYLEKSATWHSDYVILDRYVFDFEVDQSINLNYGIKALEQKLDRSPMSRMHRPDYFIFIDLPAKIGYERKLDGTPLSYLEKREELYKESLGGANVLRIDGTRDINDIHKTITDWMSQKEDKLKGTHHERR